MVVVKPLFLTGTLMKRVIMVIIVMELGLVYRMFVEMDIVISVRIQQIVKRIVLAQRILVNLILGKLLVVQFQDVFVGTVIGQGVEEESPKYGYVSV